MTDFPERLYALARKFAPHSTEDRVIRAAADHIKELERQVEE